MQLKLEIKGLEKVQAQLKRLSETGIKQAASAAINDAAFKGRKAVQDEMKSVFKSPTPYILNSVFVTKATPNSLTATVAPKMMPGGGVDPQKILRAEAQGGPRRDKRSEKLLRSAGLLPSGYQTAAPPDPYPGSQDGRGNMKGTFLAKLISYFQGFSNAGGFRKNMGQKRKTKMATQPSGVVFFVSTGQRGAGGANHLPPGIWARPSTPGARMQLVLLFVKNPSYAPRLRMDAIVQKAQLQAEFEKKLRHHIRKAVEEMG